MSVTVHIPDSFQRTQSNVQVAALIACSSHSVCWQQRTVTYIKPVHCTVYDCQLTVCVCVCVCVCVSQTSYLLRACNSRNLLTSVVCTYFHWRWPVVVALSALIVRHISHVCKRCTYACATVLSRTCQCRIVCSQLLWSTICHSILLQK
jgi:hypothetical protein